MKKLFQKKYILISLIGLLIVIAGIVIAVNVNKKQDSSLTGQEQIKTESGADSQNGSENTNKTGNGLIVESEDKMDTATAPSDWGEDTESTVKEEVVSGEKGSKEEVADDEAKKETTNKSDSKGEELDQGDNTGEKPNGNETSGEPEKKPNDNALEKGDDTESGYGNLR